jgi:hypothetical protein
MSNGISYSGVSGSITLTADDKNILCLKGSTTPAQVILSGNLEVSGIIQAEFIVGDGNGLTNLPTGITAPEVSGAITASRDELYGFTIIPNYPTFTDVTDGTLIETSAGLLMNFI